MTAAPAYSATILAYFPLLITGKYRIPTCPAMVQANQSLPLSAAEFPFLSLHPDSFFIFSSNSLAPGCSFLAANEAHFLALIRFFSP